MESNPLVSIIIPVYNVEMYLDECFNSLIIQTYKNIEIIFVDDGSTDKSGKKLDEFQKSDTRVKVIHKENGGVSSAKNVGIKNAMGEYITFVDPDDYIMSDYIEYLLGLIVNNKADVAISKGIYDNYNMKSEKKDTIVSFNSKEALIDILTFNMSVAVWNKIYTSNLIKNNNIFFYEDIYMGEGFNFNVKCFSLSNKIMVGYHKVYFYRRDNNNSATTKFKIDKWKNAIYAIKKMKENIDLTDDEINKAWEFSLWRTNVDAYTLLSLTNNQRDYIKFKNETLQVGKKYADLVFKLKSTKKDKIRALVIKVFPSLLPKLLLLRRKIYRVDVKN